MSKVVYIAEKPNVAKVIAEHMWGKNASAYKKQNMYSGGTYQGDDIVICWAHGHILEDALPPAYDPAMADPFKYPVIPTLKTWKLKPVEQTKPLLMTIKNEIKNADVVVNGGDPDREGQLLVDEILIFLGYKGKSKRIMIDAWDEKNVTRAFEKMDDNFLPVHRNMYFAGLARKMADWLVGMNFCRAYSAAARKVGCYEYLNIGRVKSWVLGMVVNREREIANFKSKKYYLLYGHYVKDGVGFSASFEPDPDHCDSEGRVCADSLSWLQGISKSLASADAVVTKVEKAPGKKVAPPLPFSLDTLQVKGSKVFGYSPQRVLDITQLLYEKKLVTYPRSDCQYIPSAQFEDAAEILPMLARAGFKEAAGADASIKGKAFNDKKVTAHHAVIPTSVAPPSDLDKDQQNIYRLIALQYIMQFYPPYVYDSVKFEVMAGGSYKFKGSGSKTVDLGYRRVFKADEEESESSQKDVNVPALSEGEHLSLASEPYTITTKDTTPPAYFKEDTIIKAMTNVYTFVDSKELITVEGETRKLREVLKECNGIGTPATRGTILEDLKRDYRYVLMKGKKVKVPKEPCLKIIGKNLRSTAFGMQMVDSLTRDLLDTAMTARMEFNLKQISEGKYSIEEYLKKVVDFVNDGIAYAENNQSKMQPRAGAFSSGGSSGQILSDVDCPICKSHKLRLASFKGNEELKLQPYQAWVCSDKECIEKNKDSFGAFPKYWGTKDKPVIEKCPVCGRLMKAVRTRTGAKKWVCFHGQDDIKKSLWLDVISSGKAAKIYECPVCKGAMRKVPLKKGGYSWVCDHGGKDSALWLPDDNGKPGKYVPCPKCSRQMFAFTSQKNGKKGFRCNHGVKDGETLFVDADDKGNPIFDKK